MAEFPQSRTEEILYATINGEEYTGLPESRIEELLLELKQVIEEGGGGGGGTSNYNLLENLPQINSITLKGDKSLADLGITAEIKKAMDMIAGYFDNTADYSAGDIVVYDKKLYKFTVDHTAGDWNSLEVSPTTVEELFSDIVDGVTSALAGKADNATTLAGYGITDAYTKSAVDTALALKADKSELPDVATASDVGLVKPDGTSITVDANGVLTAVGGGSSSLANLTDTAVISPSNEQVLKYNETSGKWENGANNVTTYSLTSIPTPATGNRWTITKSDNKWLKDNYYYGTLIDISTYKSYRSIRLYRNNNGFMTSVAFLKTDNRIEDSTPDYCVGWNKVAWFDTNTELDFIDIPIPSDANYLFVYMQSVNTVFTPDKIDFLGRNELDFVRKIDEIESGDDKIINGVSPDVLKIATYNIGHFSGGGNPSSLPAYTARLSEYKQLVYNTINPDIIGINEYSADMINKGNTKQVLFGDFQVQYEGVQRNYSCNALFSNTCLRNITKKEFACLANETITHTTAITAQDYYYLDADLYMNGRHIKVVTAHLAFDTNRPGVLQNKQIAELISAYANYDRVLMMGDWNVYAFSEFDAFVNAGYTLGNDGTYKTYDGSRALDNIIVKGLILSDTGVVNSDLSDHLPFYCTVRIPSDENILCDVEILKSDLNTSSYSGYKNITRYKDLYNAKKIIAECYFKNSTGLYCLVDTRIADIEFIKSITRSIQIRGMYSYIGTVGMFNWFVGVDGSTATVTVQLDQNFYNNTMISTTAIRVICKAIKS